MNRLLEAIVYHAGIQVKTQDDIKTRLLETAGRAFGERGFDAVGTREICQQASANIAAINYHFGDKRGLYVACLRHAQSCRVEDINTPDWRELPPRDRLRAFIRGLLQSKLDDTRPKWHLEMMLREMARPTDACQEIVEDFIRPMAEELAEILRGLLPDVDWNRRTWMIGFSMISQVLFYHINQPVIRLLMGSEDFESLTIDSIADHITRFSLAAIGHGPAVTSVDETSPNAMVAPDATVAKSPHLDQ